ncbi:MAG: cadherin domain-containing protein, partial [Gemmatimonadaceae bacterium]|nr:cadherin domain-containing protein [Acetobacteraceae bacterium]
MRTPGLNGVTEKYSDGSYLDFTDGAAGATGEYFEFTVEVPESGTYALDFRYALAATGATGVAQDRPLNLSINGQSPSSVSFPSTTAKVQGGFSEWGIKSQTVTLNAGPNTIRLASNGLNGANFDWVEIRSTASSAPVQLPTVQAETGTVGGTAPGNTIHLTSQVAGGPTFHPNFTGTGFTDIGAAADAFLELTVAAPTAGLYRLDFRYANGDSGNLARPMAVAVNGVGAGSLAFPVPPGAAAPNRFATWGFAEIEVELRAGNNVVRLAKPTGVNHGGPNIDAVTPTRLAAPSSIELAAVTVIENAEGAQAGTLSIVDEDGGTYAYTVSDTRFEVVAGQLKLKSGQALNFETGATVDVIVTADDGPTGFAPITRTFTVAVSNVNDAPTLAGEQGSVSIVAGAGFELAAELITADEDAGSTPVLTATLANGDPLPAGLALVGRAFTTDATLTPGSYNIALLASDGALQSSVKTFALTVTAQAVAPTFSTPNALSSAENQTAVATVQATDPDSPSLTYAIVGGADEALFTIDAETGALAFTSAPDFEAPADAGGDNVYDVELSVTDETGLVATQDVAVTVTDVAEAPNDVPPAFTVLTAASTVVENTTTVFDFEATDADGDAVSYTVAGVDAALFGINAEGVLSFTAAPDAEVPGDAGPNGIYQVTVQATARGVTVEQAISITVADVNEAIAVQQSAFTVTEPASAVGVITVRDEDGGTAGLVAPSFALSGTDAAAFTLNATTGALSFVSARDFETPSDAGGNNVYEIVVTATDGALSDAQAITVTVADLDETPFTPITLQAESASLTILDTDTNTNDTVVRDSTNPETGPAFPTGSGLRPGFSGTGYLDFGDTPGDRATFGVTLTAAQAGTYDLNIRYGSTGARPLSLIVNGGAAVTVPFPDTGIPASGGNPAVEGFSNWQFFTVLVTLAGGANTISLAIPTGRTNGPNLDRIEITQAGSGPLDLTADADNNLALTGPAMVDPAAATAVAFTVAGRDADIVTTQVSFDGGTTRTVVTPDAAGLFSLDLSSRPAGATTVTLIVTDDAGNQATKERVVTIAAADQPPVFAAAPNDVPVLENTTAVGTFAATDADGD